MAYSYIGTTIKNLNLFANRIYRDYPADFIEYLKSQGLSLIGLLFVDVEHLPTARAELKTPGSARNEALKQLIHFRKKS